MAFIPGTEAAEILGVTKARVSQLVKQGKLRAEKYGGWMLMIERADVERLADERRVRHRSDRRYRIKEDRDGKAGSGEEVEGDVPR